MILPYRDKEKEERYLDLDFQILNIGTEIAIFSLSKKEIANLTERTKSKLLRDDKNEVMSFDLITAFEIAKQLSFFDSIPWNASPMTEVKIGVYYRIKKQ